MTKPDTNIEEKVREIMDVSFKAEFIKGVYELGKPISENQPIDWCEMKYEELINKLVSLIQEERERAIGEFAHWCESNKLGSCVLSDAEEYKSKIKKEVQHD